METTKIYSIAGQLPQGRGLITARPFRSPHHSASAISLAGGGAQFRPGECSLANCGVLFLDELPEFSRESLEVLRQPLEDGQITVSRAAGSATYPSHFQLVAAMNPCKCGLLRPPHPAVHLLAQRGAAVPQPGVRPAAGPHRSVRGDGPHRL